MHRPIIFTFLRLCCSFWALASSYRDGGYCALFTPVPWNSTFDIQCETHCGGRTFRYNRSVLSYHQCRSKIYVLYQSSYQFLIRWYLALPSLSNFLPFHLVPPITQLLLTTGAARNGRHGTTSWKWQEEEEFASAFEFRELPYWVPRALLRKGTLWYRKG